MHNPAPKPIATLAIEEQQLPHRQKPPSMTRRVPQKPLGRLGPPAGATLVRQAEASMQQLAATLQLAPLVRRALVLPRELGRLATGRCPLLERQPPGLLERLGPPRLQKLEAKVTT